MTKIERMHPGFEAVLTVDGASGTGKTTVLRALTERFACIAVELGPVVRTVSWLAHRRQLSVMDAVAELARLQAARRLRIDRPAAGLLAASEVELDGTVMRQNIFSGDLNAALSAASLDPDVMPWVHGLVREDLRGRAAALSAREAARKVCPTAGLQIRLEADPHVRRARKHVQLQEAGLRPVWLDDVRLLGPPATRQWVIDTTHLSPGDVADVVAERAGTVLGWQRRSSWDEPDPVTWLRSSPGTTTSSRR